MRYVSKIDDVRWVQETMDRAKSFDRGHVWLNGERSEVSSDGDPRDTTAMNEGKEYTSGGKRDSSETTAERELDEQARKRARLETVEAARKRALERRQNQS